MLPENTIVTFYDKKGEVITWSSTLAQGFEGNWRTNPFAARKIADRAAQKAMELGMHEVDIYIKEEEGEKEKLVRAMVETITHAGMKVEMVKHAHRRRTAKVQEKVFVLERWLSQLKDWWDDLWG
jgi:small subunit ribosomal protein S11